MPDLLGLLWATLAGAALSLQIVLNVQLKQGLGHPALAAFVSFAVGALSSGLFALAVRAPLPGVRALVALPPWVWAGGVLGAAYVGSSIVLAPRLGAGLLVVLVVAGQLLASLLIDHLGWTGQVHPLNAWRVAGALLVVAGAALIQRH